MEKNHTVQPQTDETITESTVQPSVFSPLPLPPVGPWRKIILFSILCLVTAVGFLFVGIEIGKRQSQSGIEPTIPPKIVITATPVAVVSPMLDVTTDWQRYINTVFGFEFSYPPDFALVDSLPTQYSDVVRAADNLILTEDKENVRLTIWVNPAGFGPFFPDKIYEVEYAPDRGIYVTKEKEEDITKYRSDGRTMVMIPQTTVLQGYNLSMVFSYNRSDVKKEGLFKKILSTFRLFNQKQTDEIVSWKTYRSTDSDYSSYIIKYPPDWSYTEEFAHGTHDLKVVFTDPTGKESVAFIVSLIDFVDRFYTSQNQYLGPLREVTIGNRSGYVFVKKYDYIKAYYFPLEEGYFSVQLLDESGREVFDLMPLTFSSSYSVK